MIAPGLERIAQSVPSSALRDQRTEGEWLEIEEAFQELGSVSLSLKQLSLPLTPSTLRL
jgi:hypothetical protein